MTRVPWERLRAWIDQQVDHEREHNRPAPLSQVKLLAISMLVSFGDEEPEVGDRDYVSLLLRMASLPVPGRTSARAIC